jgi:LmbE family N-acetylglucosaminyl deacetylase
MSPLVEPKFRGSTVIANRNPDQVNSMLSLQLGPASKSGYQILCLGAHSDDIEIGCGGTILTLLQRLDRVCVHWVVFSAAGPRGEEARRSAAAFLHHAAESEIVIHSYRDGFLPFLGAEVKDEFEALKRTLDPDLILTHSRDDRHQDHRLVSDLTWNTFRNHLILEYEIPKYDGDLGQPNLFVPLEEAAYAQKIRLLLDSFPSQRAKAWFDEQTFSSLMRLRGMEANAPSRYAEAFYCRKLVLG